MPPFSKYFEKHCEGLTKLIWYFLNCFTTFLTTKVSKQPA